MLNNDKNFEMVRIKKLEVNGEIEPHHRFILMV